VLAYADFFKARVNEFVEDGNERLFETPKSGGKSPPIKRKGSITSMIKGFSVGTWSG